MEIVSLHSPHIVSFYLMHMKLKFFCIGYFVSPWMPTARLCACVRVNVSFYSCVNPMQWITKFVSDVLEFSSSRKFTKFPFLFVLSLSFFPSSFTSVASSTAWLTGKTEKKRNWGKHFQQKDAFHFWFQLSDSSGSVAVCMWVFAPLFSKNKTL